jgi:hypothetical protein
MATPTNQQRSNRWLKYMGGGFVFWAAVVLAAGMSWSLVSKILAAGLFMLLFAPQRIDDERVRQLKLRAVMWGYGAAVALVSLHDFLGNTPLSLLPQVTLTAFDGFILANAISLALFHYWHWQDGRTI